MKNRYLFKAKKESDNNWIQGFLSRIGATNSYQIDGILIKTNTICQCTGEKFRDELVFEGDLFYNIFFKYTYEVKKVNHNLMLIKIDTPRPTRRNFTFGEFLAHPEDFERRGNIYDKKGDKYSYEKK